MKRFRPASPAPPKGPAGAARFAASTAPGPVYEALGGWGPTGAAAFDGVGGLLETYATPPALCWEPSRPSGPCLAL
eukprot:scaffold680087_cov36-Prasinocladus_malaysianus.AAC.1